MNKLKMESLDITKANIDKIAEMFPQVVTEVADPGGAVDENGKPVLKKAIDFEKLKLVLSAGTGDYVVADDERERYEFTWVGKRQAMIDAATPIRKTLRPCPEESKDWATTENLYLEGDNLEVLKLLQESYLGKVKMIYIDPPYNTGNDFIYKDNFTQSREEYEEELDMFDEEGNRLFQNTETNGRFHSDWCSMIYPRLQLARNMLSDDGVIFISIDDGESDNLRKICNEVFGESNFVADITLVNNLKGRNDKKYIARANERLFMYVKSQSFDEYGLSLDAKVVLEYKEEDARGKYRLLELRKRGGADTKLERPNMYYSFYINPTTGDVSLERDCTYTIEALPVKSDGVDGRWRWGRETAKQKLELLVGKKVQGAEKYNIYEKDYLEDADGVRRIRPKSVMAGAAYSTDVATKEYRSIMSPIDFSSPKPVAMLSDLIEYSSEPNSNAIILDFFSGSATTAHAVMQLNAEDGGNRKFIMVQLPEVCDPNSEAAKAGYKTICEIGKERIRRAGAKITEEQKNKNNGLFAEDSKPLDTGFRVFKLDTTNMKDVYYAAGQLSQKDLWDTVSNIKDDRSDIDLLYGCLLDWGVQLTMPHTTEQIESFTVHTVDSPLTDEIDLIACFDSNVSETVVRTIAKRKPTRALFRDSSFADSANKINVFEIFKSISPDTTVKVI